MSFSATTQQVYAGTKDVTRRMGWWKLDPGTVLMACEKCMGLKKGEKVIKIRPIEVVSVRAEPVENITQEDVVREGFPDWSRDQFITFFCKAFGVDPSTLCNRIEFRYITSTPDMAKRQIVNTAKQQNRIRLSQNIGIQLTLL